MYMWAVVRMQHPAQHKCEWQSRQGHDSQGRTYCSIQGCKYDLWFSVSNAGILASVLYCALGFEGLFPDMMRKTCRYSGK